LFKHDLIRKPVSTFRDHALARSYEFVESLERFLLDGRTTKNAPQMKPLHCPKCSQEMRLLGIEAGGDSSELFTFECTDCGHLEVMGAPAE
jgi:transposase-like protein